MSFFRKIFGIRSHSKDLDVLEEQNKYAPEFKLPLDERFIINFKNNGGKFLYCEDLNELYENINNILQENDWKSKKALIYDQRLCEKFNDFNFIVNKDTKNKTYFFSTCEYLIANDGSLLISSNQIGEKKLKELPDHFIIFSTTSQLVESISEGLQGIKSKNQNKIPSNITAIKHFKTNQDKDFLSYGSSSKNLYLLLLEDL